MGGPTKLLAAAALVACLSGPAVASPEPSHGLRAVEGVLAFTEPATLRGALAPESGWFLHWPPADGLEGAGFGNWSLTASRANACVYSLRTLDGDPVLPVRAPSSECRSLESVSVAVRPRGAIQEVLVADREGGPLTLATEAPWTVATMGRFRPVYVHSVLGATPGAHPAADDRTHVLAEAVQARVDARSPGMVALYGFDVAIEHARGRDEVRTGAWTEDGAPAVLDLPPRGVRHEAALVLWPAEGHLSAESGVRPLRVAGNGLRVAGEVRWPSATGELAEGTAKRVLVGVPLALTGDLDLHSAGAGGSAGPTSHLLSVRGRAAPVADVAAVAFAPAQHEAWMGLVAAGLGAVALAAVAKGLAPCFTRLARGTLLDTPERGRVLEAVRRSPGGSVRDFARGATTSPDNVRYHLRVLRRHGVVRAFKLQGTWRFLPADHDLRATRLRLLFEADPKLGTLLSAVAADGTPAGEVVGRVRAAWGLTRSGAWEVVRRARREGLVTDERRGRTALLRRAEPAPDSATTRAAPG